MRKYLHFICPTDYIESLIRQTFDGEHYFLTSLGNSMTFDEDTVGQIKELLETKHINNLSFILSDDNRIVSDALGNMDYWEIHGLDDFYVQLIREKENSGELWQTYNHSFFLSSSHLNKKIKELREKLDDFFADQLSIHAKIYQRQEAMFRDIYPDLILRDYTSLN